jgi:hypothetical protein
MPKCFLPRAATLLLAAAISGCGVSHVYNVQDITNGTVLEHDKYKGVTYVEGLTLGSSMPGQSDSRSISASLNANGEIVAIWVDYAESGPDSPRMFVTANDANAQTLRVETLARNRQNRDRYASEEVAVYLPPGYLHQHLNSEINIRLEGRHGEQMVVFGQTYLEGYLAKLATAQACVKAKTC